jgi:hypothetical protein
MKVIVTHEYYGCETGCCGHVVELYEDDGTYVTNDFFFDHPYYKDKDEDGTWRKWAEEFVKDAGCDPKDLDWDNCIIVDA